MRDGDVTGSRSWFAEHRRATAIGVIGGAVLLMAVAAFLVARLLMSAPTAGPDSSSVPSSQPAAASASVSPAASGSEAPMPSATAESAVAYAGPFAAIVLVNGLNVRDEPGTGNVIGSLAAGEVVMIAEGPRVVDGVDWYLVYRAPDINGDFDGNGWVSAGPADGPYLELRDRVAGNVPARVTGLVGSTAGYVAWGLEAHSPPDQPAAFIAASTDGASWQLGEAPAAIASQAVTVDHGPQGWLMAASNTESTDFAGLWRSSDGLTWTPMAIPAALAGRVPVRLTGFDAGYALVVRDDPTNAMSALLLTSPDGESWQEFALPIGLYDAWLVEVGSGLVAWSEVPGAPAMVLYSADGTAWTDATFGGSRGQITGSAVNVGSIGDDLVAISHDMSTDAAAIKVWRATPSASGFDWVRQLTAEEQLADSAIGELVRLPDGGLAIGQSFDDGRVQLWRSADGVTWQELDTASIESEAGIGQVAFGGGGLVAVGYDVTAAGANPHFMRSSDGMSWQRESDPVIGRFESAVAGACPAPPTTMVDWLAIPGAVGAECFGDAAITFRAWLTRGGGCGGFAPGRFEPEWLANPFAQLGIVLEPNEAEYGACGSAVAHPDLELPEQQQWVEFTGHWADPAAADCHAIALRHQPMGPTAFSRGPSVLPSDCRAKFVATEVTPTSAP